MRHLARRSPAFIGMRIVVHEDHVEVTHPESVELGFESLSATLARSPAEDWPDLVDDHFRRALTLATTDTSDVEGPTESVLPHVYVRLATTDSGVAQAASYAEEIVPGLLWTFAFDRPESIAVMKDEDVRRHGFEQLWDAGLQNLARELPDRFMEAGGIRYLQGSDYVGSLGLITPWVVEAMTGLTETPHGVLVAMPARDQFIYYVIGDEGTEGVLAAMEEIGRLAAECYAESPYQLSSRVYWWSAANGFETVGHHTGIGLTTYYSDDFENVLFDLGVQFG